MIFDELGLNKRIADAIKVKGYTTPTPIQQQAIPPALQGKDILGLAQTGTGKTCAFALPILQKLTEKPTPTAKNERLRALILSPTRELAMQIADSFKDYGKFLPYKVGLIMGGVDQGSQVTALKNGVDILIATPGRFMDLLYQGYIEPGFVETFVLDEADRMLDMGFIEDIQRIVELIPSKRQTLLFSATMPPKIKTLADTMLKDPVCVSISPEVPTVERIVQKVYMTDKFKKPDLLVWLVKTGLETVSSVLIFTRTKYGADKLHSRLRKENITASVIHGDKSQSMRQRALSDFKRGACKAMVATDIAARGIDINDIAYVINYELPEEPETYVHRIGRTGRAGKDGIAVSLCDFDEKERLADIERLIKKKLEIVTDNPFSMSVFEKSVKKAKQRRPQRRPQNKGK